MVEIIKSEIANMHKCAGTQNTDDAVRPGVFTAVTMKNIIFWDVMPRDSCKK
jgi:hypothetical protein